MSRLIVKNLPKDIKKESVKKLFESQGGEITDIKLCFTKEGTFRKFAFVGYKTDSDALAALKFLNNTFMGTSKIHLEICKDLGDPSVPRPWSKYSKGSSSFSRKAHEIEERKKFIKELQCGKINETKFKIVLNNKSKSEFEDLENNNEFQEFVGVHLNKGIKQSWTNDSIAHIEAKAKKILEKNIEKVDDAEDISDTGRLFVRNLSYTCTEDSLTNLFSQFGPLVEINLPIDKNSNKTTGFAFVTFMMADHAIKAMSKLDGSIFEGRILHILPGKSKKIKEEDNELSQASYKVKQEAKKKSESHNWNALFLGQNAVVDVMANRLNKSKHDILDTESSSSIAVRMALGETELVSETREFLESEGVKLDCFGQANSLRSKTVILVKNLPPQTLTSELQEIFSKYGDLGRLLMPPFGITAIVEFIQSKDAKNAFNNLAYSKFKHSPLYLEWAPLDVLSGEVTKEKKVEGAEPKDVESEDEMNDAQAVIFVKNLNFTTAEERFKEFFSSCGEIKSVTIAKKQDSKNPSAMLSMGYGFVEYKKLEGAEKALKLLQHCELDSHKLELKKSHRESILTKVSRKRANEKNQVSSKMVVRNIPFEATVKELRELFCTFGNIKSLRLPKKITGAHRGFAFIDFTTKQDAKRAFKALCQSTHLYGRRLVLEWADDDDSVDLLRKKTAELYHESSEPSAKKSKMQLQNALENTSSDSL